MRDLLVRYLLGELDEGSRREIEERLRNHPELEQELKCLRACLGLKGDTALPPPPKPPTGLAERTAGRIASMAESGEYACVDSSRSAKQTGAPDDDPPPLASAWSFSDLAVAVGIFLAVGMLLIPAIRESRNAARRLDCQNNLRQLGGLLVSYSQQQQGYFPRVGPQENAGIFAARLVSGDYIRPDRLMQLLVCRSSPLAEQAAAGQVVLCIPTLVQLRAAHQHQGALWRKTMGGSYAYRLGYLEQGQYVSVRNKQLSHAPLLSDSPCLEAVGLTSANHQGCGQNVLYQDQSVRYQRSCTLPDREDHLFLNAHGEQAAGRHRLDVVLGRSEATPGILP